MFSQWKTVIILWVFMGVGLVYPVIVDAHDNSERLSKLEFKDARLMDVIRIMAEMSGHNIVATPKASDIKITVFLRNVTVHDAIETIARVNHLWYRRDPRTHNYRIMTSEEYSKDLVIARNEQNKIFTLRAPNVDMVADAIANLYGDRVIRSHSGVSSSLNAGGAGSGGNTTGDASGDATATGNTTVNRELSIDQLAALELQGESHNAVSALQLQQLSGQKEPIYITVVAEHNMVIVRTGDDNAMDTISTLISDLDRPIPQVLLEMKVMDVEIGNDFESVFNFSITGSGASGDSNRPILLGNHALPGGNLVFEYLNDHLKANIDFLEKRQRVNVLSTPTLLAVNNRPAKLFVGDQAVTVTGYSSQTLKTSGTDDATINVNTIVPETTIKNIGSSIEITPFINSDGTVTLKLRQENSSIKSGAVTIPVVAEGSILNLPLDTISTAKLEGTVIAKDKLTFAVGGLVRETLSRHDSRVPKLADIPVVGFPFKSKRNQEQRTELILMITPHIMQDPGAKQDSDLAGMPARDHDVPDTMVELLCHDLCRL